MAWLKKAEPKQTKTAGGGAGIVFENFEFEGSATLDSNLNAAPGDLAVYKFDAEDYMNRMADVSGRLFKVISVELDESTKKEVLSAAKGRGINELSTTLSINGKNVRVVRGGGYTRSPIEAGEQLELTEVECLVELEEGNGYSGSVDGYVNITLEFVGDDVKNWYEDLFEPPYPDDADVVEWIQDMREGNDSPDMFKTRNGEDDLDGARIEMSEQHQDDTKSNYGVTGSLKVHAGASSNEEVIEMFAEDSFPKDKRPIWGTEHLKITKMGSGWALVNYATPILYRDSTGKVYFNTQKYSVTTSRIQNMIRQYVAGAEEVDGNGIQSAISNDQASAEASLKLKASYEGLNSGEQTDARELELYLDNTSELYGQKQAIIKNVARRIKNGTYDPALAPKLWRYWVDEGARSYAKEFADTTYSFPVKVRQAVAEEYASSEYEMIMNGEYSIYLEQQGIVLPKAEASLHATAGLTTQIRSLKKRLDSLDINKCDPSEVKSVVEALEVLEKRLEAERERKQKRQDAKESEKEEAVEESMEKEAVSDEAQKFISEKIKYLVEHEGKTQEQAAAIAYSLAREKGFSIPEKKKADMVPPTPAPESATPGNKWVWNEETKQYEQAPESDQTIPMKSTASLKSEYDVFK